MVAFLQIVTWFIGELLNNLRGSLEYSIYYEVVPGNSAELIPDDRAASPGLYDGCRSAHSHTSRVNAAAETNRAASRQPPLVYARFCKTYHSRTLTISTSKLDMLGLNWNSGPKLNFLLFPGWMLLDPAGQACSLSMTLP